MVDVGIIFCRRLGHHACSFESATVLLCVNKLMDGLRSDGVFSLGIALDEGMGRGSLERSHAYNLVASHRGDARTMDVYRFFLLQEW